MYEPFKLNDYIENDVPLEFQVGVDDIIKGLEIIILQVFSIYQNKKIFR